MNQLRLILRIARFEEESSLPAHIWQALCVRWVEGTSNRYDFMSFHVHMSYDLDMQQ